MSVYTKNIIIGLSMMMALLLACAGVVLVETDKITGGLDTARLNAANTVALAAIESQDPVRTIQAGEAVQELLAKVNPDAIPMTHPDVIQARQIIAFLPIVRSLAVATNGQTTGDVGGQALGLLEAQQGWDQMPDAGRLPVMQVWATAAQADLNNLRAAHTATVDAAQDAIIRERVTRGYIERCGNRYNDPDKWETAIITKLRETLHDPSTAEILGCGEWQMTANCYERTCRLRAKNAYGAFVVGDVHVTAVKGEVVDIQLD